VRLNEFMGFCRNLSFQAEKDERFRSESKKKAVFDCFNFDMVNIG